MSTGGGIATIDARSETQRSECSTVKVNVARDSHVGVTTLGVQVEVTHRSLHGRARRVVGAVPEHAAGHQDHSPFRPIGGPQTDRVELPGQGPNPWVPGSGPRQIRQVLVDPFDGEFRVHKRFDTEGRLEVSAVDDDLEQHPAWPEAGAVISSPAPDRLGWADVGELLERLAELHAEPINNVAVRLRRGLSDRARERELQPPRPHQLCGPSEQAAYVSKERSDGPVRTGRDSEVEVSRSGETDGAGSLAVQQFEVSSELHPFTVGVASWQRVVKPSVRRPGVPHEHRPDRRTDGDLVELHDGRSVRRVSSLAATLLVAESA